MMSYGQFNISFSRNLDERNGHPPKEGWITRSVSQEDFVEIVGKYPFSTTVFKEKEFFDKEKGAVSTGTRENSSVDKVLTDFIVFDLKAEDGNKSKFLPIKNNLLEKNIRHMIVEGENTLRMFVFLQWSKNETFLDGIFIAPEYFKNLLHKRDKEIRSQTRKEDYQMMGETIAESIGIKGLVGINHLKDLSIAFMPVENPVSVIENFKGEPFDIENIVDIIREKRNRTIEESKKRNVIRSKDTDYASNNYRSPVEISNDTKELFKNRTVLSVPYKEKELASKRGAVWDNEYRIWYAPEGSSTELFKEWIIENQEIILEKEREDLLATGEYTLEVHEVLQNFGLKLESDANGHPIVDYSGALRRVGVAGKNGKDGWYRVNPYTMKVTYGDWSRGEEGETFKINFSNTIRGKEYAERSRSFRIASGFLAKLNGETTDARMEEEYKKNADRIKEEYSHSRFAYDEHPYLLEKGVKNHYLRLDRVGNLLIPMKDINGDFWSVQRIRKDGSKQFGALKTKEEKAKDISLKTKKKGTFALVGAKNIESVKGDCLVVAEGYATAATIFEATSMPTVVAFDAGNLMDVATAIKEKFPEKKLIFAADNDIKNNIWIQEDREVDNVGIEKAIAAAKKTDGLVVIPRIPRSNIKEKPSDWNDIYKIDGSYARIREAFAEAKKEGYRENNYVFLSSAKGMDGGKGKKLFEFISQTNGVIVDAFRRELRVIDKETKAEEVRPTDNFFIIAYALSKKQYESILSFEKSLLDRDEKTENKSKPAAYYLKVYMETMNDLNINDVETAKITFMENANIKEFSFSKDASVLTIVDNKGDTHRYSFSQEVALNIKKVIKSFICRSKENLSTIKMPK